ncbi:MAG: NUDIX hydrolase [Micromonosporaceae bacterium]
MTFCPRCGAKLPGAPPVGCARCAYQLYVNARPTASIIVTDGDRFLALRRAMEPKAGQWEVPGGFCDGWEHPADAAVREAREELGVRVTLRDFVGMYIGGYEFQGELLPVLDCYWLAVIDPGQSIRIDPVESSEYAWFPLGDPPPLAFTTMESAIRDARKRLGL